MTLLFPQLSTGAVAQFPLRATHSISNMFNVQEDGTRYLAQDLDPARLKWNLAYKHLSGVEARTLSDFFQATLGRLRTFTFLDPVGNLLAWSEDLSKSIWQSSPTLTTQNTSTEINPSFRLIGVNGALSQELPCPAAALVCFSLFARAQGTAEVRLSLSDLSARTEKSFGLTNAWRQYYISQNGSGDAVGKNIKLVISDGTQVEVARLSVQPQPAPSAYFGTQLSSGIFEQTRFDQDELVIIASGPEDFSCNVQLTSQRA